MEAKVQGTTLTGTFEIEEVAVNSRWRTLASSCYKTSAAKVRGCCRWFLLSLAVVALIVCSGAPGVAQVGTAASPAKPMLHSQRSARAIEDRVKVFAKNLDLNEAQQAAVKKILEQRQQETVRIRLDPTLIGTAKFDRFRALQDKTVEQIRAVLNEEQRKKYDPLAVRRIQPAPGQRSVEDWINATTPR